MMQTLSSATTIAEFQREVVDALRVIAGRKRSSQLTTNSKQRQRDIMNHAAGLEQAAAFIEAVILKEKVE
jgi:hypothetical protein